MMMDFKDRYKVSIGLFIIDILFISYHFLNIKYIHKLSKIMASGTPKPDGSKISNPWIINGSR